jgi:hypothetical protein
MLQNSHASICSAPTPTVKIPSETDQRCACNTYVSVARLLRSGAARSAAACPRTAAHRSVVAAGGRLTVRLQSGQPDASPLRLAIDPPVQKAHDENREVEGGRRRADRHVRIGLQELYLARVLRHGARTLEAHTHTHTHTHTHKCRHIHMTDSRPFGRVAV